MNSAGLALCPRKPLVQTVQRVKPPEEPRLPEIPDARRGRDDNFQALPLSQSQDRPLIYGSMSVRSSTEDNLQAQKSVICVVQINIATRFQDDGIATILS